MARRLPRTRHGAAFGSRQYFTGQLPVRGNRPCHICDGFPYHETDCYKNNDE